MSHDEMLVELMDRCLRDLGEHFDSVQLIGSFVDDEGQTHRVTRGVGNWYSRIGMAMEFIEMDAAQTTAYELKKVLPGNEDA